MLQAQQLSLFEITPRGKNLPAATLDVSGLASLELIRFKGISQMEISFEPITLLVGANNSGKTSILQAIRLLYYCIERCGHRNASGTWFFKKHVMPFSDFGLIPAHELRELVYGVTTPNSRRRGISLRGILRSGRTFGFTIYAAYSTLMVIMPDTECPDDLSDEDFNLIAQPALYVPGFFGVVTEELLATNSRIEQLLISGHHNEVLRNLLLRLGLEEDEFSTLVDLIASEFGARLDKVTADQEKAVYLRGDYIEKRNRAPLDVVSAGSGFLQVLQILTHALQTPSPVILLDEPDAHMHCSLQRSFLAVLRRFCTERKIQLIMASHSESFLRGVPLSEVRLIDMERNRADTFKSPVELEHALNGQGVWPDHPELAEVLRTKRVLLCESQRDAEFIFVIAEKRYPADWNLGQKLIQVIETEGSSDSIVARMRTISEILEEMLNGNVRIAYLRDRDLMSDEWVTSELERAAESKLNLFITSRRNRESYLCDPMVIERAVRASGKELPEHLSNDGQIAELVSTLYRNLCRDEIDIIPTRCSEYHYSWQRRCFEDTDAQREARVRLSAFLRQEWNEKLEAGDIPWKLMDGKAALGKVRSYFAKFGVQLPDAVLLEHLIVEEIEEHLLSLVDTLKSWTDE
jgi:predicted ATPase